MTTLSVMSSATMSSATARATENDRRNGKRTEKRNALPNANRNVIRIGVGGGIGNGTSNDNRTTEMTTENEKQMAPEMATTHNGTSHQNVRDTQPCPKQPCSSPQRTTHRHPQIRTGTPSDFGASPFRAKCLAGPEHCWADSGAQKQLAGPADTSCRGPQGVPGKGNKDCGEGIWDGDDVDGSRLDRVRSNNCRFLPLGFLG